jgi:hypothetical protein
MSGAAELEGIEIVLHELVREIPPGKDRVLITVSGRNRATSSGMACATNCSPSRQICTGQSIFMRKPYDEHTRQASGFWAIWGRNEIPSRAIDNNVFPASCTYVMRSFIIVPRGIVLADANVDDPVAVAEVNLDQQIFQPWLGDMKYRTWKERRPDIPVEPETD